MFFRGKAKKHINNYGNSGHVCKKKNINDLCEKISQAGQNKLKIIRKCYFLLKLKVAKTTLSDSQNGPYVKHQFLHIACFYMSVFVFKNNFTSACE